MSGEDTTAPPAIGAGYSMHRLWNPGTDAEGRLPGRLPANQAARPAGFSVAALWALSQSTM
jgi:hypothetical protein